MAIEALHSERSVSTPMTRHTSVGTLPSACSLFIIPFELIYNSSYLLKSIYLGDQEGKIDAILRLSTLPLNALSSLFSMAKIIMEIETILVQIGVHIIRFGISKHVLLAGNMIALFLSVIEIIVESVSIKRQVKFLSQFHLNSIEKIDQFIAEKDPKKKKDLLIQCCHNLCYTKGIPLSEKLKTTLSTLEINLLFSEQLDEETLTLAKRALSEASELILETDANTLSAKYTEISRGENEKIQSIAKTRFPKASLEQLDVEVKKLEKDLLLIKSNKLIRRISPWCAKEVSSKINPLLKQMKSEDPIEKEHASKQIKELMLTAKIQSKKYLYYHIVSLVIFVGVAIAMIASLTCCPPLLPAVLLSVIGTLSFASYILHSGSIEQKGWKFSTSDCIPSILKKGYGKMAKLFTGYCQKKEPCIAQGSLEKTYTYLNGPVVRPRYLSYYQ